MKIGYRRLSGAVGLSSQETGTRGMWWEKRQALLRELGRRGHQVTILGRLTKPSRGIAGFSVSENSFEGDLLLIEFGGTNAKFFGKDLEQTCQYVKAHRGPVVYVCDDPDLWFPWKMLPGEKWGRWKIWANASRADGGGFPGKAPVLDLPVSSLIEQAPPREVSTDRISYIGRLNGRARVFQQLVAGAAPIRIHGRPEEWEKLGVRVWEEPRQTERAEFYAGQLCALAVADAKHKAQGWRTGRAYHAVAAGCPAVAEEDHEQLRGFFTFAGAADLHRLRERLVGEPGWRQEQVLAQQALVLRERAILEETLAACSL